MESRQLDAMFDTIVAQRRALSAYSPYQVDEDAPLPMPTRTSSLAAPCAVPSKIDDVPFNWKGISPTCCPDTTFFHCV
jgi:hypothetical protein